MDYQMRYERLIRNLFGDVDRFGDPARLASTDYYSNDSIMQVKAVLLYGVEIIRARLTNPEVYENDLNRISSTITTTNDISFLNAVIDEMNHIYSRCTHE